MSQQSIRHHYIPVFYLQAWTDANGLLDEFSRPRCDVVVKHVGPNATGFQRHLYTVAGLPREHQSVLEDQFFRDTDTVAAEALQFITQAGGHDMCDRLRNGWSRFLNSLRQRQPERVTRVKEISAEYLEGLLAKYKCEGFPLGAPPLPEGQTFEGFSDEMRQSVRNKMWASVLQGIIDSSTVGLFISNMKWGLVDLLKSDRQLLTSDRPLLTTNGIDHPDGYIMLPISPTRIFVAFNTVEKFAQIRSTDVRQLVRDINDRVVSQAAKYVYSRNEQQFRFISNRLGRGDKNQ